MSIITSASILFLLLPAIALAQSPTQTVRGTVVDEATRRPVAAASVVARRDGAVAAHATTNISGEFTLRNVPVGRYQIHVSLVGYEPLVLQEVLVTSSKEVQLAISLREVATQGEAVVVRPRYSKALPTNTMASVSSRMLSVEEANRYAGGFDDPARLASSFAGVASSLGNNGIVVRGNAPKSLAWRIEGVEVPNPNHFADLATFGGGGLTALSGQTLANSDFHTGAFPAEFTNALSGVFDINLRKGNPEEHEHTIQLGAVGIDLASEGPLGLGARSSYLFNYRYSTLALLEPLLPEDAGGTSYQDLTLKLSVPTSNAGTFSLWGIGLIDRSGTSVERDTAKHSYRQDRMEQDVAGFMGAGGLRHSLPIGDATVLQTTLATTGTGIDLSTEELDSLGTLHSTEIIEAISTSNVITTTLEHRFGAGHLNRTGVTATFLGYDLALANAPSGNPLRTVVDEDGRSLLLAAHTSSALRLGDGFEATIGVAAQYFSLNESWTVEPRVGMRLSLNDASSVSLGYGMHSRLERLATYFVERGALDAQSYPNRELGFSKSHHFVIGYDLLLGEQLRLKVEPYYQRLFDVPVVPGTSRSTLNSQNDWFASDSLANDGAGENLGVDITLERFLDDGFYYLLSGSLVRSRYTGGDGIWRSTRYDRGYVVNALAGKEWQLGARDQNTLNVGARVTLQGGDRITPFDVDASRTAGEVVLDESRAFEDRLPVMVLVHMSASYRINLQSSSWTIGLNVLNATGQKEPRGYRYNSRTKEVELEEDQMVVPNLSIRWEF